MNEMNSLIGSVFQNSRLLFFTDDTTSDFVFPMENYGWSKVIMEKRLNQLTEKFGLVKLLDKNISILSSGEWQMIALALTLIINQNVVLFDEPTENLDYGRWSLVGLSNGLKLMEWM